MLLYGTFYFKYGRSKQSILPFLITYGNYTQTPERLQGMPENDTIIVSATIFKSNVRETWRVIMVSESDIFLSESLRNLAERLSQSETRLPLRHIHPKIIIKISTMKEKIFNIIQIGDKSNRISRAFDIFITFTIICNIIVTFLETFDQLTSFGGLFTMLEHASVLIFCIEYALRIWTADYLYPEKTPGRARFCFLISFDGVVDLLTIIPVFFLSGFIIFRMLRVARIFHLFRLNAKYDSFNIITTVLYEKRNQIISSVFIVMVLMLASSMCMYSVEHNAQPDIFRNAFSGIWWSMSTLLTVGYGDIYPVTTLGRVMAICIAYLGVGAVAIPTGIISAGFVEQYQRKSSLSSMKDADIQEIAEVFVNKRYAGKTIEEMEEEQNIKIFLVLRDDLSVLPQKNMVLKLNDIVIIRIENEA